MRDVFFLILIIAVANICDAQRVLSQEELNRLDEELEMAVKYDEMKLSRLDSLKSQYMKNSMKPQVRLRLCMEVAHEYEKFISPDKALKRRFQSVMVVEPNELETKNILLGVKKIYEDFHNVKITESNIDYIVSLANKYIYTN